MHNIYEFARKDGGPWAGRTNPVADVRRRKQEEPARNILTVPEFEPVLDKTPSTWRGPVATAVYGGLREGEIFGLLKADVDFDAQELRVHRSWDAERTKDNKVARIPIVPQLVPFLREAMKSPGVFVFPKADGSMQPRKLRLGTLLRRAIAAAGLLEGYEHRCRAWRCGWREQRQDPTAPATCPRCGKPTAWPKPIPRHVRFHDTRHSFGTAVVRAAGTAVAQKALRHSDVRLTIHTYGHLDTKDVRAGLTGAFGTPSGNTSAGGANCTELQSSETSPGNPFRTAPGTAGNQRKSPATLEESQGQVMVGETGFEPATPWSRRAECRSARVAPGHLASYPVDKTGVDGDAGSHTVAPLPPVETPFGAFVVRDAVGQLLTVREVAALLRVSRATIYRLVQTGALPTLRVSNSIRIPEMALALSGVAGFNLRGDDVETPPPLG